MPGRAHIYSIGNSCAHTGKLEYNQEYNPELIQNRKRLFLSLANCTRKVISNRRKQPQAPNGNGDLQQRWVQANPKGNSYKFTPKEDGITGFPIDPPARVGDNGFPQQRVPLMHAGRSSSTLDRSNGTDQKTQRFYTSQLSNIAFAAGQRGSATHSSNLGDGAKRLHLREHRSSSRYSQLTRVDPSGRSEWAQQFQERPSSSHRKDGGVGVATKDPTVVSGARKNRIHYSGPLMPHGGNMEEILKSTHGR